MIVRLERALPFVIAPFLIAGLLAAGPAFAATPAAAPDKPAHAQVEQRITDLRTKLKITPDEMPVFDQFATVMRDNANNMDTLVQQRRQTTATGTAVDDMKSYQSMAQAHVDDLNRLVPAFEKLYDALSPDQKKLADQSFQQFQAREQQGAKRG